MSQHESDCTVPCDHQKHVMVNTATGFSYLITLPLLLHAYVSPHDEILIFYMDATRHCMKQWHMKTITILHWWAPPHSILNFNCGSYVFYHLHCIALPTQCPVGDICYRLIPACICELVPLLCSSPESASKMTYYDIMLVCHMIYEPDSTCSHVLDWAYTSSYSTVVQTN